MPRVNYKAPVTGLWKAIPAIQGNAAESTLEAEAARDIAIQKASDASGFADNASSSASAAAASALQLAAGVASPAGTYDDLAALNADIANVDISRIYVTLDDGNWNYYITGASKNILNPEWFVVGRLNTDGSAGTSYLNRCYTDEYILCDPQANYVLTVPTGFTYVSSHFYDADKTWILSVSLPGASPSGAAYVRVCLKKTDESVFQAADFTSLQNSEIQLEKGSVATSYQSFGAISTFVTGGVFSSDISTTALVLPAGDEESDDRARLQAMIDAQTSTAIEFQSGKTYILSDSLNIDVSKIKSIFGNGARFVIQSVNPAFIVTGHKTDDSGATPTSAANKALKALEMVPVIEGLVVYSTTSPKRGTGVRISGTFGTIIRGNHFFDLDKGVEYTNINRDTIISENHIYNCRIGIHWNVADSHQQNIVGNHILGGEYGIYVEDGSVHNIQITGNDFEGFAGGINRIFMTGAGFSQVQITGNTLEEHLAATGELIKLADTTDRAFIATISGNEMSGGNNGAISTICGTCINITGNNFQGMNGLTLSIHGNYPKDIVISSNTFQNYSTRTMYGILVSGELTAQNIVVANNTASNMRGYLLRVIGGGTAAFEKIAVSNNTMYCYSVSPVVASEIDEYAVDIGDGISTAKGLMVIGNSFGADQSTFMNGFRVNAGSGDDIRAIIKNNFVSGTSGLTAAVTLPEAVSEKVVVGDNLTLA